MVASSSFYTALMVIRRSVDGAEIKPSSIWLTVDRCSSENEIFSPSRTIMDSEAQNRHTDVVYS